ncbi:hypothetical protein HQO82_03585 [Rhodococcus fascians]|nr:hypothetical protein [Rhodococcus fascians]MBY4112891.1 hypothetical protein [Rhodococcus fascians]
MQIAQYLPSNRWIRIEQPLVITMKARLAMKPTFSALCADGSSGILYVPNFCKIAETIGEDIRLACT